MIDDTMSDAALSDEKPPTGVKLLQVLGPGLITGASDDDPSGIATYSQAGAQFGFDLGWTLVLSWPLMCAIQEISAADRARHRPWYRRQSQASLS
jgi:Mn2+/Fe2+ NRAMP family transporter